MTKPEERTCDACGAAAMRDVSLDCKGVHPLCGPCAAWNGEAKDQLALRALVARRAAQPKEVDPRTLPVGARVRSLGNDDPKAIYRITEAGKKCINESWRSDFFYPLDFKAILISLPPAEVELGSLAVGEWFDWAPSERLDKKFAGPFKCLQFLNRDDESLCVVNRHDWMFLTTRRVLRVPAPSSTELLHDRIHSEDGPARPVKSVKVETRWKNSPESEWPRLDAILAAQVASGGQSCKAARSLIERADRVRREEQERAGGLLWERNHNSKRVHTLDVALSGIASLRLKRPLISWRRK